MLMLCFVPSPEQWSSGWGKPRSHLIEHLAAAASRVWCHLPAGAGEKRDGRAGGRKKEKGEGEKEEDE